MDDFDPERRWMAREDLPCREVDPDLFFPDTSTGAVYEQQVRDAKSFCFLCPALVQCARDTLGEPEGIFGGLTPDERRAGRERLAKAIKKWPEEKRLKWGRLCEAWYDASGSWTRVQEMTGIKKYTAQELWSEWRVWREAQQEAQEGPQEPVSAPSRAQVDWPTDPGRYPAWVVHESRLCGGWIHGQTEDAKFFYVAVRLPQGAHIYAWIPEDDTKIYVQQPIILKEKSGYRPAA